MTDGKITIGFIGLGNMGRPMTTRLSGAGHRLLLLDIDRTLTESLAKELGQQAAGSPGAIGAACDVVITMLPDGRTVQRVLLGEAGDGTGGVAGSLKKGATVIDMSSSSPVGTRELGEQLAKMDIRFIDAPVSGGVRRAVDGTLAIMVGGDEAAIEAMRPVFAPMGKPLVAGGLGAGHAIKALNNYVSAAGLLAACEAVRAGSRFGLDPATMVDIINASTGVNNSTLVKMKPFVLSGTYADGFGLALMAKDLRTALEVADATGMQTALAETVVRVWNEAEQKLGATKDTSVHHTAIDRYLGLLEGD
ncbi:MAG: NAD(P)-dependent oxidoreductase [Rhodocyclaceae bacterium]|jgi:3-hydroxyisobutyrate dehydrogenase|nr:NAD(P)-dependent oxidoreductase [Rhodocyclaceae bacterium]MCA3088624.1 NAD(P)-dependent oxidoreductase [Rhodocyclaceae bacterium]MCA3092592.1 NAD(P)-dependent oxidoreductase [Rhodocyclaceae bacterium]MCA3098621.1 NAD(P)-dependent oxidoreductase [Rhodocyclaceae bacterium]MCA3102213.1 NAD(P)-dependent oxidoreductase [Rhodocyclaceae bacterium]